MNDSQSISSQILGKERLLFDELQELERLHNKDPDAFKVSDGYFDLTKHNIFTAPWEYKEVYITNELIFGTIATILIAIFFMLIFINSRKSSLMIKNTSLKASKIYFSNHNEEGWRRISIASVIPGFIVFFILIVGSWNNFFYDLLGIRDDDYSEAFFLSLALTLFVPPLVILGRKTFLWIKQGFEDKVTGT